MKIDTSIIIKFEPGIYEPSEDTYLLIEALDVMPGMRVLEIGCGSGVISLHCAKAGANVTSVDISDSAIQCTRENVKRNSLKMRVLKSDLFDNVSGKYDLIIFNPPYLPAGFPDDSQWTGGDSGHEVAKDFLAASKEHLNHEGRAMLILSTHSGIDKFNRFAHDIGFKTRVVLEKKLFFETIYAIELEIAN